jgi:hypothetical protein
MRSQLGKNIIYEGLAKVGQLPVFCIAILSLDSHVFLLLLSSFEPWFLWINWFAHNICQAIDHNGIQMEEYGGMEWAYLVIFPMLYLPAFPVLGFQDALPDDIRGDVGLFLIGGLTVALLYSNVAIFMGWHQVFSITVVPTPHFV